MDRIYETDLRLIQILSNSAGSVGFSFLPLLFESRGLSDVEIGIIAIPFSLFLIISNTIFGKLSDSKGRRPYLMLGLWTSALTTVAYIFPANLIQFFLVRILHGITLGIFPAAITGIASDRKIKLGSLSSFGSLGWGLGALIGGIIASLSQIEIAFIISAIVYLVAFLIAIKKDTGLQEQSIIKPVMQSSYVESLKKNWREYLILIFRHGSASSIWVFWALYLKNHLDLDISQIGVIIMTNWGTQFFIMKRFTDKFTPKKMFIVGGFVSSLAFFSFPLASNFIQMMGTHVILGISWSFFYVGGLRSVEMNSRIDGNVATSVGLFNASISISQIIGPILALYFISISNSYTLAMTSAGWITLVSIIIYLLIYLKESFR